MFSCPPYPLRCGPRCWVILAAIVVYFLVFPADVSVLLAPLRQILSLTYEVALGAWLLAAVVVICWTARWLWPPRRGTE